MLRDPAAKRYAQAAFELARDGNAVETWEADMRALAAAVASPEALAFLDDRRVPADSKLTFLRRAADQPAGLVWNLVQLLEKKGRLALLPQIAEQFQVQLDEHRGITHAQVLTAVAMSDNEKQALAGRLSELTGKTVLIQALEEPDILGGLVARIGDRLIDGSTRSKLVALKSRLAGSHRG